MGHGSVMRPQLQVEHEKRKDGVLGVGESRNGGAWTGREKAFELQEARRQ